MKSNNKKILITGGAGFVGQQIVKQLIAKNADIRLVLRSVNPFLFDVSDIVITPDLFSENAQWWSKTCEDVDTILHLAWYAKPNGYLQSEININCLQGTITMAQGAAAAGVRRFVGAGTCFEYDLTARKPLSPSSDLKPKTLYASAKAATFYNLSQFLPIFGIKFAWCRIFYLYGENEHPDRFIPYLHSRLRKNEYADLTSGNQIRDYLKTDAAAQQLIHITLGDMTGAFNICSGEEKTIKCLALEIANQYQRPDLLRFGSRPDNLTDPAYVVGIPYWK